MLGHQVAVDPGHSLLGLHLIRMVVIEVGL